MWWRKVQNQARIKEVLVLVWVDLVMSSFLPDYGVSLYVLERPVVQVAPWSVNAVITDIPSLSHHGNSETIYK